MNEHHQHRDRRDQPGGTGTQGPSDMDEEMLRRLLHDAMEDVEPTPGSLEEIRRAVPVRRARRRQAMVGAAAGVLLVGTAVPALMHVARSGPDTGRSATAASSREAGTGTEPSGGTDGTGADSVVPTAAPGEGSPAGAGEKDGGTDPTAGLAGTGIDPEGTMAATSPTCTRAQLGQGGGTVGQPGQEGKVYGSFRVVNISGSDCTIDGRGSVTAVAQGAAESSGISVVDHTTGDAATGLPDPSANLDQLILKPGQAYVVKFAWVPAGGGPGGCRIPDSSPTPSNSSDSAPSEAPTGGDEPESTPAGSILLSHTPQAGEPVEGSVTLQDACAGTVYRTGVLES
ncbi:hypothetical protein [Streptomyces meridianus]|uniref:DUF4232 domain-containing protein n=1 Tax=Streptomyces meridianus TaxID=2938945 RepID=A0ABT0X5B6_9ACTN|nr:hypothetical protein [Streptomyces meridianus]MCM2577734.1 hypothetical protein [Streptomyces meridianus]